MPYVTQQDLVDRYGDALLRNLSDRSEPASGAIDAGIVMEAITEAEGIVDSYVGRRYQLPLATVPPIIATITRQIAIVKLHIYEADPKIRDEYGEAMGLLKDLSEGRAKLDVAGLEAPQSGTSGARVTDRARPMTGDNLKGWI